MTGALSSQGSNSATPGGGRRAARSNGPHLYRQASALDGLPPPLASGAEPPGGGSSGLGQLLRTVKRRQGTFVLTFIVVSSILTANTLRQRLFAPVYEGGFEMQIVNPFEMNGAGVDRGTSGSDSGLVESIARGGNRNDLPNMVRLLRRPLLIAPVADQQAVSMQLVMRSLRFGLPQEGASNILAVSLRWDDPVKGKQILDALARSYVVFSQVQRQEALDSGVRFLGKQAPELLARMDRLQDELRRFRVHFGYLDPTAQSSHSRPPGTASPAPYGTYSGNRPPWKASWARPGSAGCNCRAAAPLRPTCNSARPAWPRRPAPTCARWPPPEQPRPRPSRSCN